MKMSLRSGFSQHVFFLALILTVVLPLHAGNDGGIHIIHMNNPPTAPTDPGGTIAQVEFTALPSSTTTGQQIVPSYELLDANGETVTESGDTIQVTSSDGYASLPADSTEPTGYGTFDATFYTAGTQSITVTDVSNGVSTTMDVNVSAAPVVGMTIFAPGTTEPGAYFYLLVTPTDQNGNPIYGDTDTFQFTSSDAQAVLPQNTAYIDGYFAPALNTLGNQTITVTDLNTGVSQSVSITVSVPTVAGMTISAPSTTEPGAYFYLSVTPTDQNGDPIYGDTDTFQFTSSDAQAVLPPNTTNIDGKDTYFAPILNTLGTQTITVTDLNTGVSQSVSINVSPLPVASISVSSDIDGTTTGAPFTFYVQPYDQNGDLVADCTDAFEFSSSDSGAVLPESSTLVNGIGSFSATFTTPGEQTIEVYDPTTDTYGSINLDVTVAPVASADPFVPVSAAAGTAFQFTVTPLDQDGNIITGCTDTFQFSSSDGAAVLPGATTLPAGTGTFSATLNTVGSQTITVTDITTGAVYVSSAIDVENGATGHAPERDHERTNRSDVTTDPGGTVASISLTAFPSSTITGQQVAPVFTLLDANGAVVTANSTTGVADTIQITSSDPTASLPADSTISTGSAEFSAVFYTAGTQSITVTDVNTNVSSTISYTVSAAPVTGITLSAPASTDAGVAFGLTVTPTDQYGNPIYGSPDTFQFGSSDAQAQLPQNTTIAGSAVYPVLNTVGNQTITVTDPSTNVSQTVSISVTGSDGTALGYAALAINTGAGNTGVGAFALTANAGGAFNTAVGAYALADNVSGTGNEATGAYALNMNTTGAGNTANGYAANLNNTTGANNTATGVVALLDNTTGANNTADGANALLTNNGSNNTATGADALNLNTTGADNTASGYAAALYNTTGSDNTATGFVALLGNTTGFNNTATGASALYSNTTGANNTANGAYALNLNTTGADNMASGYAANLNNTTGANNTATGVAALLDNTTGSNNTATGIDALLTNNGSDNTANGASVLYANTSGSNNTANGFNALLNNTSGAANSANGAQALAANTTGYANTANGEAALVSNTSGYDNTADGYAALHANTGSENTAEGFAALYSNTGAANAAHGYEALYANTDGYANTASGAMALVSNTIGYDNTATGYAALFSSIGSENTGDGFNALGNDYTGQANTALGYQAGSKVTSGSLNIEIGNAGTSADARTIRLGTPGTQSQTFIAGISGTPLTGVEVVVSSTGQLGTMGSSERFKKNIHDMGNASEALLSLRPVTFQYKPEIDPTGMPQFGLIAEEVEKVNPDLVIHDANHQIYTVRYEAVNAMLLNECQKQHETISSQEKTIAQQQQTLAAQQKALADQKALLQKVAARLDLAEKAMSKDK